MLVFPQLTTGTVTLYPLRRVVAKRTVTNRLLDGGRVAYADPDWAERRWELHAIGMRREEAEAIEALYRVVQGPLGTFTFLEPAGNLLARSEEFAAPEWTKDPLITTMAGIGDPFGTERAIRVTNTSGAAAGGIKQTLGVPGNFRYAMSVWARAAGGLAVTLEAAAAGGQASRKFALTASWQRLWFPVALALAAESVSFRVRLDAATSVDLFGMQVEAQPGMGTYQKTGAQGGVHPRARFAADGLLVRAQGNDVHDAVVQIVSKGN